MLQTMLLIRILQIIKANGGARKVALILDEFKHLLCAVSLDALGTVRELGAHALLAHQSMGDLGMCPGLRREDVEPRVVDNTTLKLIYRINDAKTSANFAALSGKQRTHIEGIRGLDDERKDQRTWTESQEFLMSEDIFTRLHRPSDGKDVVAAGVLFGHKSAKLIAVSPIQVKGMPPSIAPAPIDSIVTLATPEVLI
jgi:type IV secretory pathway TraG/TraD family ATPase VirD4